MPGVVQHLIELAQRAWVSDRHAFTKTLSSQSLGDVFTLVHLTAHSSANDWHWLLPIIRKSLEDNPPLVAPLAAALALGGQHSMEPPEEGHRWNVSAKLNAERACMLLPNQEERLEFFSALLDGLKSGMTNPEAGDWDGLVRDWVIEAMVTLTHWVNEGTPCPNSKEVEESP